MAFLGFWFSILRNWFEVTGNCIMLILITLFFQVSVGQMASYVDLMDYSLYARCQGPMIAKKKKKGPNHLPPKPDIMEHDSIIIWITTFHWSSISCNCNKMNFFACFLCYYVTHFELPLMLVLCLRKTDFFPPMIARKVV